MIEVAFEDEAFKAKGSFSLGIAWVFTNEDFGREMIMIDEDILDLLEERDEYFVGSLLPFIKSDDPDEIAKALTEYYNQKEREIAANSKQINDSILHRLFWDIEGCSYPFREIPGAVSADFLEAHKGEDLAKIVYSGKKVAADYDDCFDDLPNNGSVDKPDIEAKIREVYPMFNLDDFIKSFKPESLFLNGNFISFRFSDGWGAELACGAYDELDENFAFTDWHNH